MGYNKYIPSLLQIEFMIQSVKKIKENIDFS